MGLSPTCRAQRPNADFSGITQRDSAAASPSRSRGGSRRRHHHRLAPHHTPRRRFRRRISLPGIAGRVRRRSSAAGGEGRAPAGHQPIMGVVHYRYRSGVQTFPLPIPGTFASVAELKRLIAATGRHGAGRTRGRGPRDGIALCDPGTGEGACDSCRLRFRAASTYCVE
jgi:hypothetical protein